MHPLKLLYPLPDYKSHRRTAASYQAILRDACELVTPRERADADLVVLHGDPDYELLYDTWPDLARKYVIAYCVWEATDIPDRYKRSIGRVQEIWTCSRYCQQVFSRYHPSVHYVPHVIEREMACSDEDLDHVKRAIAYEPGKRYYVIIARRWAGRKNVGGLVPAFERLRSRMPDARLIVKVVRPAPHDIADPRIRWIHDRWSDGQISALYRLADVYVSPHFGEGWGLTMSDAMLFGKPVVATGYSGNLEFMHDANSILLPFDETPIRDEDLDGLLEATMKWAYPREADLERTLLETYDAIGTDAMAARVGRASSDIRAFDRRAVASIIRQRVQDIRESL